MHTTIKAPANATRLSDIFNIESEYGDTLPKNCIFNKVTTGCGGTYIALTSSEPTIIVVPTKALVKDKVKQEKYKSYGILGVSSEFPLKDIPKDCKKIICTYQSLPKLVKRLQIKNWNLVVDEMHLLTRMLSFSKPSLRWLLNNFKNFKSYCFMSATVPKEKFLLPQLKDLDRVTIEWSNLKKVSFECYYSENIQQSMLQIIGEHLNGTRKGNAYFFYNSIEGICKIINILRKNPEYTYSAMVSRSPQTIARLKKCGTSPKDPHEFSKINFVTSASFEGVDYYDKEGVTYIISDSKYDYTKYSIVTTIPQIVGRLRDSVYNDRITVIFDNHELVDSRTEDEFEVYIGYRVKQSNGLIKTYYELRPQDDRQEAAEAIVTRAVKNIYVEVEGLDIPIEEIDYVEGNTGMELVLFEEAKILDYELYELFKSSMYINDNGEVNPEHITHKLGDILGDAPTLTNEVGKMFNSRSVSLERLCKIYIENKTKCEEIDPEWFEYIDYLGVERVESCSYKKINVKSLYNHMKNSESSCLKFRIQKQFTVGSIHTKAFIKNYLVKVGLEKAKATTIQEYFEVKNTTNSNGENCFKIIRKL